MPAKATISRTGDQHVNVYEWQNDTISVLVTGEQTGGAFTLTEDRMKPCFCLGLHIHREHAETFHVLDGELIFQVDGETITAGAGTTVHVPPGVPHGVRIDNGQPGRMLMFYTPAGFEHCLAEMKTLTSAQFADVEFMRAFNQRYDIFILDEPAAEKKA